MFIFVFLSTVAFGQKHKVFHTSVCYDMLCSFDNYEELITNPFFNNILAKDSTFKADIKSIKQNVRPSNICNLYASLPSDKNNIKECFLFLKALRKENIPEEFMGQYVENIFSVMPQILNVVEKLIDANYQKYWEEQVYPNLKQDIDNFTFEEGVLDKIHEELIKMSGNGNLNDEYSKIFILNIDNAFSLNDGTFCCTSALLDKEIAKNYRIDFIQVYIHENLHRLYLSKDIMRILEKLYKEDAFYRKNENIARSYGEGINEAFIVAAETYISRKLGLKNDEDVFLEFKEYIDGSLILAPIIYSFLPLKENKQPFDSFLLSLFETEKIKSGNIEKHYNEIMRRLQNNT